MTLYSSVGDPSYGFRLHKPEWKKDELLDGFQFPFNFYGCAHGLFRRFSLWDSSIGVCVDGVNWYTTKQVPTATNIPLIRRLKHVVWSNAVIKVGDFIDGDQIVWAENIRQDSCRVWQTRVDFGYPPEPQIIEEQQGIEFKSQLLKQQYKFNDQLIESVCDLFDQYTYTVIAASGIPITPANITVTAPNGPCTVIGVVDARMNILTQKKDLEQLKSRFKNKMIDINNNIRDYQWQ